MKESLKSSTEKTSTEKTNTDDIRADCNRRQFLKSAGTLGGLALGTPLLGTIAGGSGRAHAAAGKTPVRIASWMQFEPGRKQAWQSVLDKFNAQSANTEVSMIGWPFPQYANQVLTQIQTGGLAADLVTAPPDLAARLFSLDQYLPLTDAIESAGITPDPGLHGFVFKDGEFYGVSTVTVGFGLLYNKSMLEKAKLEPPTTPEEWIAHGEMLTQRPDIFGVIQAHTMAEAGSFWFNLQNTVNAYDGVWAEGKTPMVTSEPVIRSLEMFKKLYDTSIPKGLNDAQMMSLMGDGRAAMGVVVSATVNILKTNSPKVYAELRSAPSPWPGKKETSRVHPISLYRESENKEAAMEFLAWLFKPENMAELTMLSLDAIPPFPELNQVAEFGGYLEDLPWLSGYVAGNPVTPMDLMGDFITANDEFGTIVMRNYQSTLTKDVPVAESMAKAQSQLEALAKRLKS